MKNKVLLKVLASIVLAFIAGFLTDPTSPMIKVYDLIGQLFLNALTLVVVPLVASSIITGTARMGSEQAFEKLGAKTFGYFFLNSISAAILGLMLVLLIQPGTVPANGLPISHVIPSKVAQIQAAAETSTFDQFAQILLKIIPSNILAVASQGQMLGLIFFCLLFGFFISRIDAEPANVVLGFWRGIFQIMMKITHLVMKALPIGVFGLVAKVVATTGVEAIRSGAWFFLTVSLGLFLHMFAVLPVFLKTIAKVNPIRHFQAMGPAILTALSTSSSAATLPVTIECMEKRAGVSNRITSFSVPLGTALNMAGTSLYACVTTVYIAQAYGIELSFATQMTILIMSFLTSFGMAGIPSASLVAIVVILHTIGIPAEGIGLVLAVERLVDMLRTVVNMFGNSCSAVLLARSEGEKTFLTGKSAPAYD